MFVHNCFSMMSVCLLYKADDTSVSARFLSEEKSLKMLNCLEGTNVF